MRILVLRGEDTESVAGTVIAVTELNDNLFLYLKSVRRAYNTVEAMLGCSLQLIIPSWVVEYGVAQTQVDSALSRIISGESEIEVIETANPRDLFDPEEPLSTEDSLLRCLPDGWFRWYGYDRSTGLTIETVKISIGQIRGLL